MCQQYWHEVVRNPWIKSQLLKRSPHFHYPFWQRNKSLIVEVHRQPVFEMAGLLKMFSITNIGNILSKFYWN